MMQSKLGRRRFLKYGASAVGFAALTSAGLACSSGDDDDDDDEAEPTSSDAAAGDEPTEAPDDSDIVLAESQVLRSRFFNNVLLLDPASIFGIEQETLCLNIYSGLTTYEPGSNEPLPDLAESWSSDDNITWTFNLRQGVQWQKDYGELTADDVIYSYSRVMDPATGAAYAKEFGLIDSIEALDDYTIVITLSSPDGNFPHQVANYHQGSVISRKAHEELGDDYWLNPVGTGPFILSDLQQGQSFSLVRFDDYFMGPATLERIDFQIINDQDTTAIALVNGELDIAPAVRSEVALERIEGESNIVMHVTKNLFPSLWMFNTVDVPALADKRVRQAIAHAMDTPLLVERFTPRLRGVADNLIPDWMDVYTSDVPKYEFDPEKSKALLAEAGYADGITIKMINVGNPTEDLALQQAMLAEVGINIEFDIVDRAQFNQRRTQGAFELALRGFPAINPDQIFFGYLHPDNIAPKGFNGSRYSNPAVTEAMESARSETDPDKRLEFYYTVQQLAMEDLPYVPTTTFNEYWPAWSYVKGVGVNNLSSGSYYTMKIEAH